MSNPKLPTYARPCASTTMSLHAPGASADEVGVLDERRRLRGAAPCRSSIDTTSMRPSGSQPRPDGCCGTSTIVSALPSGSIATTRWSCWSLKNRAGRRASAVLRGTRVRRARRWCRRHGSGPYSSGRPCERGAHVVERPAPDSGSSGTSDDRGEERADAAERDRPPELAERVARARRRAGSRRPSRARRARRAARSTCCASRWGRARRRACPSAMPPAPAAMIDAADMTQSDAPRRRGRRSSACRSRSRARPRRPDRRPRTSASRPPSDEPERGRECRS